MAVGWLVRALLLICSFFEYLADDSQRVNRFEYKFSFKGPHLVNKNGQVPFWTVGGSAIPSNDQVRITPSLRDKRGYMWSKNQYTGESFEIEVALKVTGQGRVGADGMAIWFTEVQGQDGSVFGSSSPWKGLGILLDSFDNDGQNNNPFISIIVNDGSLTYEHHSDGHNQALGGCLRNFRNRPYPVRVKARYYESVLTVWFHQGMAEKPEYELCTRVEDVHLPKTGIFGVSAATGGLADDHDVISFTTHSITSPSDVKKKMSDDEMKKLSEQYDQMTEKFQKEKDEYAKAHPTQPSPESQFETSYDRDLRLIYEGQNSVHYIVNNLHKKTGELTTQVNELQRIMSTGSVGGGGGQDAITRQEVNTIINLQNQLNSGLDEVKNLVRGLDGGVVKREVGDDGGNTASEISSLRNSMEIMMENVNHIVTKQQFAGKVQKQDDNKDCPPVEKPNCIGPGYFVFLIVVQAAVFISYLTYKSQKEAANKKFF